MAYIIVFLLILFFLVNIFYLIKIIRSLIKNEGLENIFEDMNSRTFLIKIITKQIYPLIFIIVEMFMLTNNKNDSCYDIFNDVYNKLLLIRSGFADSLRDTQLRCVLLRQLYWKYLYNK